MKNKNNILLAIAMGSVLTACGGGGTSSGANSTQDMGSAAVLDEMAPIISLNGNNTVSILVGDDYQDLGAFANDSVDGSVGVIQTGSVDASTPDSYIITYNAEDAAGNTANEVTRTVTVIDGKRIVSPQKLYGVEYDIYDGFEFDEVSINDSSISFLEGEILNSLVTFNQGDSYYSVSTGEWAERNPSSFGFELVDLDTVGVVNGVRKVTIESIDDISGQSLIVGGNEIDNNLPDGSARYTVKTEFLENLYSVYRKVSFENVVAQTLDTVLTNGCGDTDLIDYLDSDQLTDASIPCNQTSQVSGTLTANTTTGTTVADAGLWSIEKIAGSEIDVLTIKLNPSYLRAGSDQLSEHAIFAVKDGEVWTGEVTVQGDVDMDVYYNDIAVQSRILGGCFKEDTDGDYIDC